MLSCFLHCRRLVARTLPFQGGEAGSIPVDSTNICSCGAIGRRNSLRDCKVKVRLLPRAPKYAVVALWEGDSLSARLRWVRFPSAAPVLLCSSKHGVCASLLMRNELGSIPRSTAKQLGAVVGYGVALQASCLEGFDFLGFHQLRCIAGSKPACSQD